MKTRNSLVSNSSSCSFIILREDITKTQEYQINYWRSQAPHYGMYSGGIGWDIEYTDKIIKFSTPMDGFDMIQFLEYIGIDKSKIKEFDHANL